MRVLDFTAAAARRRAPRRPGARRGRPATRRAEARQAIDSLLAGLDATSTDVAPSLSGYIIVTGVAA